VPDPVAARLAELRSWLAARSYDDGREAQLWRQEIEALERVGPAVEKLWAALLPVGGLTRWTGGCIVPTPALDDLREIRRVVTAATGLDFPEYT